MQKPKLAFQGKNDAWEEKNGFLCEVMTPLSRARWT